MRWRTIRQRLWKAPLVAALMLLMLAPQAGAVTPVADYVHQVLTRIQSTVDLTFYVEDLIYTLIELASIEDFEWRDPRYLIGEAIYLNGLFLDSVYTQVPSDISAPVGMVPLSYFPEDMGGYIRELYPYTAYAPRQGRFEHQDFRELFERRLYGIREAHANAMSVYREHQSNLVEGVVAFERIKRRVEMSEGNEQNNELVLHVLAYIAEELMMMRQLQMTQGNVMTVEGIRSAGAEHEEVDAWMRLAEELLVDPSSIPYYSTPERR